VKFSILHYRRIFLFSVTVARFHARGAWALDGARARGARGGSVCRLESHTI
jgi:hypothetical protein